MPKITDVIQNEWLGLVTKTKDPKNLKRGEAQNSLNWLTGPKKDNIQLRQGTALLGTTRVTGANKVTGMAVAIDNNGTQVPFYSTGRKIKYYNGTDTTEIATTNLLPAAASGEDISFDIYQNITGNWVYFSSPNSSIYRIHVSNPGTALNYNVTTYPYRGFIKIDQSRMFLWNTKTAKGVLDKNTLFMSYADHVKYSDYTTVSTENFASGDGTTKTFTATLAQIPGAGSALRTCFAVTVTDGTETFTDNKDGTLTGSLGGTGTVNYVSGSVSVTFNTAPVSGTNNITSTYNYEALLTSIADFSQSATRTNGQGGQFAQYGGGNLQTLLSYNTIQYALHALKTWAVTIPADDTTSTNLPYRTNVGIPYFRAAYAVDDGVIYLDFNDKLNPMMRMLQLQNNSTNVIPKGFSDQLDLSQNSFVAPVVHASGDFYLLACQGTTNGVPDSFNNFTYVYNKISDQWDKTDISASCFANFNGGILAGDPISSNVFQIFSGYDDDTSLINNFWIGKADDLDMPGLKRVYRLVTDGFINPAQSFDIYVAYDKGQFVKIDTINGNGYYVDGSQGILIGTDMVGLQVVGTGVNPSSVPNGYHFRKETIIASDLFEYVTIKFVATSVGALQINSVIWRDIRYKGRRVQQQYLTSGY